jgi:hypothetical protein
LICDDQENFTQRRKGAKKAAKEPLGAFCFLPAAYWLLLTAFRLLAKRNAFATSSTDSGRFAFTIANAAAESASVGRGDFFSWTAVGSNARHRADGIWRDLVCD